MNSKKTSWVSCLTVVLGIVQLIFIVRQSVKYDNKVNELKRANLKISELKQVNRILKDILKENV